MQTAEEIRTLELLNKISEQILNLNSKIYRRKISHMTNEQLGYEFTERIGDELREFDWMMEHRGRKFVEQYLADIYDVSLFERLNWRNFKY